MSVMTFTLTVSAQMKVSDTPKTDKVGEYKQLGKSYAEITKSGNTCTFIYRDDEFSTIDTYRSFTFSYSDLDTLYKMFTDFEGIEKDTEKMVDLEDGGRLYFRYKKTLGKMYADVIHINSATVSGKIRYMTEKQLKELFGKK